MTGARGPAVRRRSPSTLARRILTVPAYVLICGLAVSTLPITLPVTAAVDALRRTPWGATRSVLFFTWYLTCEVIGILASFALWSVARATGRTAAPAYVDRHFALQQWWARTLLRGAELIFRMRFEVEGDGGVGPGPMLVFIRHASVGDTVLPAVFLSGRHGLRLRYVLKRELLWDPCLDIVGNRLPNYFVRRDGADTEREVAEIRRLAEGIGRGEGVLIYPEGTRFTAEKRMKILARMEQGASAALAGRARRLRHVLPPRLGGPVALLESRPDADVVFCAHVGFDDVTRFSEFLDGGLVDGTVRVAFWRIPAASVPRGEACTEWLFEQWQRVDDWVGEHRGHRVVSDARAGRGSPSPDEMGV